MIMPKPSKKVIPNFFGKGLTSDEPSGINVSDGGEPGDITIGPCVIDEKEQLSKASHLQGRSPCRQDVGHLNAALSGLALELVIQLFGTPQPTDELELKMRVLLDRLHELRVSVVEEKGDD